MNDGGGRGSQFVRGGIEIIVCSSLEHVVIDR